MSRGAKYTIHKKIGAAQFSLLEPTYKDDGYIERTGCVLLEMAPGQPKGDDVIYLWDQKISFALALPDIQLMVEKSGEICKIVHVQEKNGQEITKTFKLTPGQEKYAGTYMMELQQKAGDQSLVCKTALGGGEYDVLMNLLLRTVPVILGW